ncbi:MAG TPA: universal stress protein [Bryobacteraceae bacterium]|nr:universal stress protein [Bryobacteraceae bacterium]
MGFRNILFPVDFSERSHAAVPHVKAMAERFCAAVTLLHVVEGPAAWAIANDGGYYVEFDMPRLLKEMDERLAAFAAVDFPSGAVTRMVETGDPGTSIAQLAKTWGTDLIMLPTHGHGLFRSALIGSVAAKVLHDAHCPVWTGAHLEKTPVAKHREIRTVMCALDLEEGSLDLLRATARFATECKTGVYIVHAVPGTRARPDMYFDVPLETFLKDNARREIAKLQKEAGTAFGVCLEAGGVSRVVHDACEHHNADLVITGRGAIRHFAGRLRTHAYGIIRDAGCPVLSIPPREIIF